MALEKDIIDWAATRPWWQRYVLRRVASGVPSADTDVDTLLDQLINGVESTDESFTLSDLPQSESADPPVCILSVSEPEHVT